MAGSITTSAVDVGGGTTKYTVAWVSDSSGNVSANPFDVGRGRLCQVKFIPGSGAAQPTDQYDVVMNDSDGVDVFQGAGANLSNSVGAYKSPTSGNSPLFLEPQTLTPVISNAGNAKSGTIIVYMWP